MARFYYPATELIAATGAGTPAALTLAPAAEFTVWSAETGGSQHTNLKAADGTTNLPVNGSGNPFADSAGWPPDLWGPDGVTGVLWRQVGTQRSPMYPSTELHDTIVNGARKNAANVFSGAVQFTSGTPVAFTTTPTASGLPMLTSSTLAAAMADVPNLVAFLNATGQPYTVYINATTGVWPNGGARVHMSGAAMTGFTGRWYWDSQGYIGASQAAGIIDGDFWDERIA